MNKEEMLKIVFKVIDDTEEWVDYAWDDDEGSYIDIEESVKWLKKEIKKELKSKKEKKV